MSDPHQIPGVDKTRRAEPIQPDRPGRGTDAEPGTGADSGSDKTAEDQKSQSDDALKNVREGY